MVKKKQKNMMHIGNILNNSLRACRTGSDYEMTEIWALWDSTVGEAIAQNARPAAFKGNLLLVNVTSSAWLQHLSFLKSELILKINSALERKMVKDIKFKIGNIKSEST